MSPNTGLCWAETTTNLGIVLRETGEPRAATEAHWRANAALEALVKARPGVPEDRRRLAASYTNLGNELSFTNEPRAAMEASEGDRGSRGPGERPARCPRI